MQEKMVPEEEASGLICGSKQNYSEEDLELLSHLVCAEMGGSWVPDDIQLYVGSVVLNRVAHPIYPDTIPGVIYDPGQYYPEGSAGLDNTPDERTIANMRYLLENGSVLPENVVFQANFEQGNGIYYEYYDPYMDTITYFCYL